MITSNYLFRFISLIVAFSVVSYSYFLYVLIQPENSATKEATAGEGEITRIKHHDAAMPSPDSIDHPSQKQQLSSCPLTVQRNKGLFEGSDEFSNVILLVSCNYAYYDMLQNWEFLASQINLKWAVLALDKQLYKTLGPERAIFGGRNISGPQMYRQRQFFELSCHKLLMVLETLQNCTSSGDIDGVVFSDVDNIFYQNPFIHDLGKLILSGNYDYVYQSNQFPRDSGGTRNKPRRDVCLEGLPREEGNTGFYYVNGKSSVIKTIFENTINRCQDMTDKGKGRRQSDDQQLFWQELWKVKNHGIVTKSEDASATSNVTFHHCNLEDYSNAMTTTSITKRSSEYDFFTFCCMDPYYYPVGMERKPANSNPISFHANHCYGKEEKIKKLLTSRPDHYGWNESRIILTNQTGRTSTKK